MKEEIFYDSNTLEIKEKNAPGALKFETDTNQALPWNWDVVIDKEGNPQMKIKRQSFTDEEWEIISRTGKL